MSVLNGILLRDYRLKTLQYFNRKQTVIMDSIMMLRTSNQVLCDLRSKDLYDMMLVSE